MQVHQLSAKTRRLLCNSAWAVLEFVVIGHMPDMDWPGQVEGNFFRRVRVGRI